MNNVAFCRELTGLHKLLPGFRQRLSKHAEEPGNEAGMQESLGMRLACRRAWERGWHAGEPGNEADMQESLGMRLAYRKRNKAGSSVVDTVHVLTSFI